MSTCAYAYYAQVLAFYFHITKFQFTVVTVQTVTRYQYKHFFIWCLQSVQGHSRNTFCTLFSCFVHHFSVSNEVHYGYGSYMSSTCISQFTSLWKYVNCSMHLNGRCRQHCYNFKVTSWQLWSDSFCYERAHTTLAAVASVSCNILVWQSAQTQDSVLCQTSTSTDGWGKDRWRGIWEKQHAS